MYGFLGREIERGVVITHRHPVAHTCPEPFTYKLYLGRFDQPNTLQPKLFRTTEPRLHFCFHMCTCEINHWNTKRIVNHGPYCGHNSSKTSMVCKKTNSTESLVQQENQNIPVASFRAMKEQVLKDLPGKLPGNASVRRNKNMLPCHYCAKVFPMSLCNVTNRFLDPENHTFEYTQAIPLVVETPN